VRELNLSKSRVLRIAKARRNIAAAWENIVAKHLISSSPDEKAAAIFRV
jgi:hypothetical protein